MVRWNYPSSAHLPTTKGSGEAVLCSKHLSPCLPCVFCFFDKNYLIISAGCQTQCRLRRHNTKGAKGHSPPLCQWRQTEGIQLSFENWWGSTAGRKNQEQGRRECAHESKWKQASAARSSLVCRASWRTERLAEPDAARANSRLRWKHLEFIMHRQEAIRISAALSDLLWKGGQPGCCVKTYGGSKCWYIKTREEVFCVSTEQRRLWYG